MTIHGSFCVASEGEREVLEFITNYVILHVIMTGAELRKTRRKAGWSQARLAARLGVTQAYLSFMESGQRRMPDRIKRSVASVLRLPPTCLPLSAPAVVDRATLDTELEQGLARLGYPGLEYRRKPGKRRNPGELLLMALAADEVDPRLVEGLPWLLLRFDGYNTEEMVTRAKSMDLQNRFGFAVSLARRVAEHNPLFQNRLDDLEKLEQALERSRLAREDTYGKREMSARMREWLKANRSPEAEHWNLLTDLKPEHLPYAQPNPGTLAQLSSRH